MKKIFVFAICMIACYSISAQDDFDDFKADFDKFKEETEKEYDNFREQCNAEYAQFLKEAWEAFDGLPGVKKPKDQQRLPQDVVDKLQKGGGTKDSSPKGKSAKKDVEIRVGEVVTATQLQEGVKRPEPVSRFLFFGKKKPKAEEKEKEEVPAEEPLTFEFYGTQMTVHPGDLKRKLSLPDTGNEAVGAAWELCSLPAYTELLSDCLHLRDAYHLCDWAYLQMLKAMTDTYFGADTNESVFLTAYIYCQSGYQMRLAQTDNRLIVLYATDHGIYDQSFYTLNGQHFYPFAQKGELGRIRICNHVFPKEQAMLLLVPEEPLFSQDKPKVRTIQSREFPELQITVSVNKNLIDFFEKYPTSNLNDNFLTRWAMYANTPLDEDVKAQIYPILQEKLKGLSEREAVSKLLSLLQSGLVYKYDEDVWGEDRAFFAEETLFYPYADCEDRSILFSRLVRDVLGLKAVLVYYPNHLATAVHFNEKIKGDYIMLNGERYLICDPTNYVAAPGVTMEGMDNSKAKAIVLN